MRKILSILFLFATITAMAGNVTIEEAQRKAQAFFMSRTNKQYQIRLAAKSTQIHRSATQTVRESYYVFNVGEDNGYILVSGDDRTPAILGYADKGNFDANSIPANMKAWLQNYEDQLDVLSKSEKGAVAAASEHQAIRPLIASTWNQGEPYNNMCPMDGEQRSLTGCVATVMAQIINYWQYPESAGEKHPGQVPRTYGRQNLYLSSCTITSLLLLCKNHYCRMVYRCPNDGLSIVLRIFGFHPILINSRKSSKIPKDLGLLLYILCNMDIETTIHRFYRCRKVMDRN